MFNLTALRTLGCRFRRQPGGSVMPVFALALLPLVGLVGAAVDYSRANDVRTGLQGALDVAVLTAMRDGTSNRDSAALSAFNGIIQGNPKISAIASSVQTPTFMLNKDLTYSGNANAAVPADFLTVFKISSINVAVKATAAALPRSPLCVLALDPSVSAAFQVNGSGVFTGKNCAVQVNSSSATAIGSTGSAKAVANDFCVAGGGSGKFSPAPTTGCQARPDPFASLTPPTVGSCAFTNLKVTSSKTLNPGVYCGGLTISGDNTAVTFSAGTYIIKDGPLSVNVQNDVSASGVTFYLTGNNATASWAGGGQIKLSAPTSGPMAGILFFQDSAAAPGATSTLMGDSSASYEGLLYFPTQNLTLTGDGSGNNPAPWTAIVAKTVKTSGDGDFTMNYSSSTVPFPSGLMRDSPVLTQ